MSKRHSMHDNQGVLEEVPGYGITRAAGLTVPTDATTGYAPGCLFTHLDGSGDADNLFINVGSLSSCDFDTFWAWTIADASSYFTATTIEGALTELALQNQSVQRVCNVPMGAFQEADGTALADVGAGPTPGWESGASEGAGIQWQTHANPDPIGCSQLIPNDLDPAEDVVMHFLAYKSGATAGDTVNFTVTIFNNISGALFDADSDFGGEAGAMTGDATAKTIQETTLTLAAANIAAGPGTWSMTIQPKDGELGTDNVTLLAVWFEYTGKHLTS